MKYKIAPEDDSQWKCNWIECAGAMGLAGRGVCSFQGQWHRKKCSKFMTEEAFSISKENKSTGFPETMIVDENGFPYED